jgi:23S rRNA (cytosine1962-C5)-methyltransferase
MSDDPQTSLAARPVARLRPKAGKRYFAGAPWVYADELVMDRRTRAIAPGAVVTLQDAERRDLATAAFNPDSAIALRVLDDDPAAVIDRRWLTARLAAALQAREALFDAPFYRLVHAEGDGLPGLVIDRFGDALAIQPNAAWAQARLDMLMAALDDLVAPRTVVLNAGSRARALEGLDGETRVLRGAADAPVKVAMNGATYLADLAQGQKTGLFYDQRPNHAFAARLARGGRVLDVFSHVGGFALAALAGGAASALAVDGSPSALALAEQGAALTGVAERFATRRADAFDAMRELIAQDQRFEVVICDPPAFAPTKQAVAAGLRAYERTARLAARLAAPGGALVLCSCSHAVDADGFREACARGLLAARRRAGLIRVGGAGPDHPVHPALPETGYLKALTFRLD